VNRTDIRRYRTALQRLGITAEAVLSVPQISPMIDRLNWRPAPRTPQAIAAEVDVPPLSGRELAISLLRTSDHEDAARFFAIYDSRMLRPTDRTNLPLEAFAVAAGILTSRLLALIVEAATREGQDQSRMIIGLNAPAVMRATAERALDDNCEDAQKYVAMFHKMSGAMPAPKGSTTIINANATSQADARAAAVAAMEHHVDAPPPAQTIRRLADRFNEERIRLASTSTPALAEANPSEELGEPEVMPPEREAVPVFREREE
jgi:hypothetical protein